MSGTSPPAACPHCGERLPPLADAICPECGRDLDDPPDRPRTPAEQKAERPAETLFLREALGGLGVILGLAWFFTGGNDGWVLLIVSLVVFAEANRRRWRAP